MYEAIDKSSSQRSKRDWLLISAVGVAIALLLALTLGVAYTTVLTRRHNAFLQDVASSLVYAREHDTLEATLDDAPFQMSNDRASVLYERLALTGMGRPSNTEPSGGMSLSFGDGSSLRIGRADLEGGEGLLVCYTRTDGSTFAYDTDQLTLEELIAFL